MLLSFRSGLLSILCLILLVVVLPRKVSSLSPDDLVKYQCSSNDVNVIGLGQIENEPCYCSGTFTANVSFHVANTASASRYCASIYLCGIVDPVVLLPQTIGNTAGVFYAQIPNYPCGTGVTCFGAQGPNGQGAVFPKGKACDSGTCCDTITWNQNEGSACPSTSPIKSQCRHHQICIQGKKVTLQCTENCKPPGCGKYTSKVTLCQEGITGSGPFKFEVTSEDFNDSRWSSLPCETFDVPVTAPGRTFKGTVSPPGSCAIQATSTVSMAANSELSLDVQPFEQLQCDGSGQIRASAWPTDSGIATASASLPAYHYQFSVDQVAIVSFAPNTNGIFQYTPPSDGTCHTVQVSAIDPLTGCASPVKEAKVSTCVVSVAC